ncbi:MAG: stalk domain-containing protein [Clostridium sp.]|nr:stalk domain-containing protein [Clostridium sp.]
MKKKIITTLITAVSIMMFSNFSAYASAISLDEPGTGRQFTGYYIINGEIIPDGAPVVRNGLTFIPGLETARALGIEASYDSDKNILTIKANGNVYEFKNHSYYYTKNGEKVYFKVINQNGSYYPLDARTGIKSKRKDLEIPLKFFTQELGYSDKFSVDSSWCLTLGSGIKDMYLGATLTPTSDFLTGVRGNKDKTIEQGWICPILKSTSIDDVYADSRTLMKELDFVENGSTSASYQVNGVTAVSVGPYAFGNNASHFSGIFYPAHNSSFPETRAKMQQIMPQVFKFYFPNNYEKAMEIMERVYNTKIAERHVIDGRDTLFNCDNIMFSKVNENLKGYMGSDYNISSVIGSAYDVKPVY